MSKYIKIRISIQYVLAQTSLVRRVFKGSKLKHLSKKLQRFYFRYRVCLHYSFFKSGEISQTSDVFRNPIFKKLIPENLKNGLFYEVSVGQNNKGQ